MVGIEGRTSLHFNLGMALKTNALVPMDVQETLLVRMQKNSSQLLVRMQKLISKCPHLTYIFHKKHPDFLESEARFEGTTKVIPLRVAALWHALIKGLNPIFTA